MHDEEGVDHLVRGTVPGKPILAGFAAAFVAVTVVDHFAGGGRSTDG
ncbi:hypothetical protein [Actinoplanes regularis]|nr:hypothetical protein [Actinoplanes regularis]